MQPSDMLVGSGDLEVTDHSTGDKCVMKFIPYSYFSIEEGKVIL